MFPQLLVALLFVNTAVSQTSALGPYGCRVDSGISQLPACDRFNATQYSCFAGQQTKSQNPAIQSCYCKQNVLNDLVDCGSEFRQCYENNMVDSDLGTVLHQWSTWCSGFTSTSFTLPVSSTLTKTLPTILGAQDQYCSQVGLTSCQAFVAEESTCLQLDRSATASTFLSCACKTSLLSLASICFYDVAKTCYNQMVNVSTIPLFSICGSTYINGQLIFTNAAGNKTTINVVTTTAGTRITAVVSSSSSMIAPSTSTLTSSGGSSSSTRSSMASTSVSAQSSSSWGGNTIGASLLQASDREWMGIGLVVIVSLSFAMVML